MNTTCPKCGASAPDDAHFCHRCGEHFHATAEGAPQTPASASSDPLTRLRAALADRYAIERVIGRGGMATVFLANDLKHDREVAIKVLHPELAASLGADRFEREIRLEAKLQHPHILALYDSGAADGLLYYVMPFVKGESLRDRLKRDGMLPVEEAISITLEVADALGYAHAQGIIHRDIKPENILLSGGHALVADFGIARVVSAAGAQRLTQTGIAVGTPVYMSPEQASADAVGPTADIYSLGCVLYEMLAGSPPFAGKTHMAIMAQHLMEQVPSIRIVRSAVPDEVEIAINAALGKVPADRPQSAAQFVELLGVTPGSSASLRTFIQTPPGSRRASSSMRYSALHRAMTPWWRRPKVLTAAAGTLLAGIGGGWFAMTSGGRGGLAGENAHRVAVLYFKDLSKDASLGPLADGFTESLISALSDASSLTVISQSGVQKYRATTVPPDSIARALRAGFLVRGEVEPEGNNISVSIRLDDASGVSLKRARVARPAGNLVAMRDTLALIASDLLKQQLGEEIRVRESAGTSNAAAWLLLQRGRMAQKNLEAFITYDDTAGVTRELRAADSLFAAAEAADPTWPEPVALRAALAYRRSRLVGRDPAAIRPWISSGLAHAERALRLDADNADALEMRGTMRYWAWFSNLETDASKKAALLLDARADLERATTANPRQAGAWATLASLYYQLPKASPSDAYLAAYKAYEVDEFATNASTILSRLFYAAYDMPSFDKARQWCREFHLRFPADVRSLQCQLYLMSTSEPMVPNVDEAWRLADSVLARTPAALQGQERLIEHMMVAAAIAKASATRPSLADSARRVARRSEGDAQVDGTRDAAFRGAYVHTILGDTADAIRLLKEYFAANPQKAVTFRDDAGWWFRDIEKTPQFRLLVGVSR